MDCTRWLKNQHILSTSSSCIDLIFTSQPNLITESGVHSSLHSNCYHLIIFAKFNLEVVYPPSWEVWHYKDANTELIRRAINEFNWQRAFLNTSVNEKVDICNSAILNILSNFITQSSSMWWQRTTMVQLENKSIDPTEKMLHWKIIVIIVVILTWNVVWDIEVSIEKYHNTVNKLMNTQKKYAKLSFGHI